MVKTCPTGRHIAYEPLPDHCLRLRHTYPGVDVRQAAVADQPGQRSFNFVPGAPALSGFLPQEHHGPPEGEQINVPVVTLDDDLPDGYVPSLIKIDVEGAEELVIRGAMAALRRHHPTVVFEHGLAARYYGSTAASIHELLCDRAGLRIFDLDGNGPYSADGLKSTTFWNFVAHR
jgi:FkbM family methyltransferase